MIASKCNPINSSQTSEPMLHIISSSGREHSTRFFKDFDVHFDMTPAGESVSSYENGKKVAE